MTESDRARVFEKFYRGSAAAGDRKGFGLGLLDHSGAGEGPSRARNPREHTWEGQHVPGGAARHAFGSCRPGFRSREPVTARTREDRMTRSTAPHDSAAPHHVLVIEDEPQMRAMLTDNLEFEGYRVTSVESGEEALREFNCSRSRC